MACVLALVVLTAPAAGAQSVDGLTLHLPPELSSQQPRMTAAATAAAQLLRDWFGPLDSSAVTIEGVPWRPDTVATSRPGSATVPLRWFAPVRDQSNERALIGALAAQYWLGESRSRTFQDALAIYTAARAIHHQLEGSNFDAPRFFGGHISFPLRSLLLSPPVGDPRPRVWRFDELHANYDVELSHDVRALQTIERYVGWPTMLETLSALRAAGIAQLSPVAFGERLSEIRGTDLRVLVNECFRADATFDYAVASLASVAGASGLIETTVTVVRPGTGRLILREDRDGEPSVPVVVRFADGSEYRDVFDGGLPVTTLVYSARTPAVSAFVDADAMLLLDVNRENNAMVQNPPTSKVGIRLALHWLAWLQNAMLTYTALV